MHKIIFFLLLLISQNTICFGQELELIICGKNNVEQQIIDSLTYTFNHRNLESITKEVDSFIKKTQTSGYINTHIIFKEVLNNQHIITLTTDIQYSYLEIERPKQTELPFNLLNQILPKEKNILATADYIHFIKNCNQVLDLWGYGFTEIELSNIKTVTDTIKGSLVFHVSNNRKITNIHISGYEKFPDNFLKNIKRKNVAKTFSQENMSRLESQLDNLSFVQLQKTPEVLFTPDSTNVYLTLSKIKSNKFDGYIGVTSNDTGGTTFNGYLDLELINSLNKGEKLTLYWKNNGENRKTFKGFLELPYIFKSPLGITSSLEIFSETEQFQNTTIEMKLGYFFQFNAQIYLGYESNQSASIQTTSTQIQDYNSTFYNLSFVYKNKLRQKRDTPNYIINTQIGQGKRTGTSYSSQQKVILRLEKNFFLHHKHLFNCKTENFILSSKNYLTNELYRFGGIQSIRGFNENTLQANQLHAIMTEYRFYFAPKNYIHTIIDYGYANDLSIQKETTFKSFGLGLGLATKNGLLQLIYANGTIDKHPIDINNSIVHVGYKSYF